MTTLTVSIPAHALRAFARHVAPKTEKRFYLVGVHVQKKDGYGTLAATDGHIVAVHRFPADVGVTLDCILPRDVCAKIPTTKGNPRVQLTLTDPGKVDSAFTLTYGKHATSGKIINAKFPDWRKLFKTLPRFQEDEPQEYNPVLAAALSRALREAEQDSDPTAPITIGFHGLNHAGSMVHNAHTIGLIMPYRTADPLPLPEWVKS